MVSLFGSSVVYVILRTSYLAMNDSLYSVHKKITLNSRNLTLENLHVAGAIENVYIEWPRVGNFINLGGGDPLCTLHRAEGLYGWVRCRGYMRDSLYKSLSG